MTTDSPTIISPDQARADAIAGRELIKYYQEFFRWRSNRWAIAATNKLHKSQGSPSPYSKKTIPPLRRGRRSLPRSGEILESLSAFSAAAFL